MVWSLDERRCRQIHDDPRVRLLVQQSVAVFGGEEGSLLLASSEAPELIFVYSCGENSERLFLQRQPTNAGLVSFSFLSERPLAISDVESDGRHDKRIDDLTRVWTRSMVTSPIFWRNDVVGVLTAINLPDQNAADSRRLRDHELFAWILGTVVGECFGDGSGIGG